MVASQEPSPRLPEGHQPRAIPVQVEDLAVPVAFKLQARCACNVRADLRFAMHSRDPTHDCESDRSVTERRGTALSHWQ
jgi:hypothetical protein